jgi:hypothetical protein
MLKGAKRPVGYVPLMPAFANTCMGGLATLSRSLVA